MELSLQVNLRISDSFDFSRVRLSLRLRRSLFTDTPPGGATASHS